MAPGQAGGNAPRGDLACRLCGATHGSLERCPRFGSPPVDADALIGQVLGNFRIVRRLGTGGMGV